MGNAYMAACELANKKKFTRKCFWVIRTISFSTGAQRKFDAALDEFLRPDDVRACASTV